jgi:mono/diheme cytochrome c family protein
MRAVVQLFEIVLAIAIVLAAGVVLASEWTIRRPHEVPDDHIAIPHDAAALAEGSRLAQLAGCRGCHGPNGEGAVWSSNLSDGTIAPPAIARKIARYSNDELVRLLRYGVKKDGSTLFIMSTTAIRNWSDEDLGRIIAWARSVKPGPQDSLAETRYGPMLRLAMLTGTFQPSFRNVRLAPARRPAETGRYFYDAICSECHHLGMPTPMREAGVVAPALAPMAASYDLPGFRHLLRTGVGKGKRDLGLMREVATESAQALSDAEISALHSYLVGEAAKLRR